MPVIKIPGKGDYDIRHVVSDFDGTIAADGWVKDGISPLFNALSKQGYQVHILTGDMHGTVEKVVECAFDSGVVKLHTVGGQDEYLQKMEYVKELGAEHVFAVGNGNNDQRMLEVAKVGVCVVGEEGCSINAMKNADITVNNPVDAFKLLTRPKCLVATLKL